VVFSTIGGTASITDAEPGQAQPAHHENRGARLRAGQAIPGEATKDDVLNAYEGRAVMQQGQ